MNQFARVSSLQAQKAVPPGPLNVMIEMSARCPQKCPMCPLQGSDDRLARDEGLMDERLFRRIVDQLAEYPPDVLRLHYSGESTVHPKFGELGRYARAKLPDTHIQYNTGGLLWTTPEKRRDWLGIDADLITFSIEANRWLQDGFAADGSSWDTATKRKDVRDEYRKFAIHPYRAGAPWSVCVPNLIATAQTLRAMQKEGLAQRTSLHIQHMITREQEAVDMKEIHGMRRSTWEIEFSIAFWKQHGVTVQYVPVASIGGSVDNSDMRNDAFQRKPMGNCKEVYTNFIISWTGQVAACCVDHGFRLLPSSLADMSVRDAWNHPALTGLREQHRGGGGYPEQCKKCLRRCERLPRLIAECGVNWKNLDQAEDMIRAAADAGFNFAKFQLFDDAVIEKIPSDAVRAELAGKKLGRTRSAASAPSAERTGSRCSSPPCTRTPSTSSNARRCPPSSRSASPTSTTSRSGRHTPATGTALPSTPPATRRPSTVPDASPSSASASTRRHPMSTSRPSRTPASGASASRSTPPIPRSSSASCSRSSSPWSCTSGCRM